MRKIATSTDSVCNTVAQNAAWIIRGPNFVNLRKSV
jgi:hypothetical protein